MRSCEWAGVEEEEEGRYGRWSKLELAKYSRMLAASLGLRAESYG